MQGGDSLLALSAALPNITGSLYSYASGGAKSGIGAINNIWEAPDADGRPSQSDLSSSSVRAWCGFKFDASHSNSIYGNGQTVQPPALVLIPQIKF